MRNPRVKGAASAPTRAKKAKAKAKPRPARAKASADDDAPGRGDRSKRLLDLVMLLLRARTPVTYREIREQFPGYQTGNPEAGLRAFERDKADLLELGVPIRYITPDEDDSLEDGGYVIDLKRFRLPEVRLTADEVSALVLAASVARAIPGGTYPKIVDLALRKLAFDQPERPDTPTELFDTPRNPSPVLVHFPEQRAAAAKDMGEHFATLEAATRFRKRVTMTYQAAGNGMTSRREVDPYGLVYREGAWYLVGWCHLRREVRSFRVDRIHEAEMAPKPKSPDFERPPGFDVRTFVNRSPWTFTTEPIEEVELELRAEASDAANEDFGPAAAKTGHDGAVVVRFPCGNPEFAVSRVLAAKGAIVVRDGDRLRRRLEEELTAIADKYEEPA
ncbi:MAG TPA: WYL domain-containing protein [Kofleriaceae bacterium]|nr:WYL domain-containing protein [Kofleriaceae bacterium]